MNNKTENQEYSTMTLAEKNHFLYLKQKAMLDTFLLKEPFHRPSMIKVCMISPRRWERPLEDQKSMRIVAACWLL